MEKKDLWELMNCCRLSNNDQIIEMEVIKQNMKEKDTLPHPRLNSKPPYPAHDDTFFLFSQLS